MIPSHVPHPVFVTSQHNPESEEPIWPISNDYRSCIWDWSEMEAGKESALIVANAIMTNSKYFWCPHLERVHTVSELWCLVWHEFCLFSVSDCVFITWYLSNTSCLLRAIGMFVVQYLQGVLELYMVGVRRVRSVDKWLATLQGSKYPQAVPCGALNWLLTNKTLWNFHFQNYNYRMFPALLQTTLGLWGGKISSIFLQDWLLDAEMRQSNSWNLVQMRCSHCAWCCNAGLLDSFPLHLASAVPAHIEVVTI